MSGDSSIVIVTLELAPVIDTTLTLNHIMQSLSAVSTLDTFVVVQDAVILFNIDQYAVVQINQYKYFTRSFVVFITSPTQ